MTVCALIRELGRTDALDRRTAYAVAVNQFGHAFAGLLTTLVAIDLGAHAWAAVGATAAVWVGAWEGLQYSRGRMLGRRVRRRWDWATDGAAYLAGALAVLLAAEAGWIFGAALIVGTVGAAVAAWGER